MDTTKKGSDRLAVVTDLSSCHHAVAWQLFQAVVRQLKSDLVEMQ